MSDSIRLLIVDDEPDMLRSLRRILRLKDYEVETAESGEQAIACAREFAPHGILMDLRMPGMNGVEAYREIRKDCPDAFVCFMTAHSDLVGQARAESRSEVLTKPLDVEQMCELVQREATSRPVLIVDDDHDFGESLRRVLKARGFDIDVAHSAATAREVFEKRPRAVVLLDMKLNGDSGFQVLLDLRKLNANAAIIAMSANPELQQQMYEQLSGATIACFAKPLDLERLTQTLDEAVGRGGGM